MCLFCLLPVEIGAASDCVVPKVFLGLLIAKVFQGVSPQQVTHGPKCWGLLEPVQLGHTRTHIQTHIDTHERIEPQNLLSLSNQKKIETKQTTSRVFSNDVTNIHVCTCTHPVRAEHLHGNPHHTGGRRCHTSRFTMETLPFDEQMCVSVLVLCMNVNACYSPSVPVYDQFFTFAFLTSV